MSHHQRMHTARSTLRIVAAALVAACGGSDATGPADGEDGGSQVNQNVFMTVASGVEVYGRPGQALGAPVIVQVTDAKGTAQASAGVTVSWSVTAGGGSVTGASSTDASGTAAGSWTLGSTEGVQRLHVKVGSTASRDVEAVVIDAAVDRPVVFMQNASGEYILNAGAQLMLAKADGSDPMPLTLPGHKDRSPAWSPDGTKIAFVRQFTEVCAPLQGEVMMLDVATLDLTQLTHDGECASAEFVSWSPDGASLAFDRNEDVVVLDVSGGARRSVAQSPEREGLAIWGAPGIAYSRQDSTAPVRLYLAPTDGSTPVEVLGDETNDYFPLAWSPDGTLSVVRRSPSGGKATGWSIWNYDTVTGGLAAVEGTTGAWGATWSPDGTKLLMAIRGNGIGECGGVNDDYIAILDPDTGEKTPFTEKCGTPSAEPNWRRQ